MIGTQSAVLPNILAMSCKARLAMLVLSYPMGRALAAPWRG